MSKSRVAYAGATTAQLGSMHRSGNDVVHGLWGETWRLVFAVGLLLFVMTQPAFGSYFFGENLLYLGQYRAHGSSVWRALFAPVNTIYFRPVFVAASLP